MSVTGTVGGVVAGDFNGDGKIDLVANSFVSQSNNQLLFYAGKGNGTFAAPATTSTGSTNHLLSVPVDINGDNKLDILAFDIGNTGSTQVDMLLGNGDGTFTAKPSLTLSNYAVGPSAFADFNGDGDLDIVIGTSNSILVIGKGAGDGSFTLQSTLPTLYEPPSGLCDRHRRGRKPGHRSRILRRRSVWPRRRRSGRFLRSIRFRIGQLRIL
jgi:hypothetical protein